MLHRASSKDTTYPWSSSDPMLLAPQQVGQQTASANVPRRPSPLKFFSSSAVPKSDISAEDPQKIWTAGFLTDLRCNRPARPTGSRPLPKRYTAPTTASAIDPTIRSSSPSPRPICSARQTEPIPKATAGRCTSVMSHRGADSALLRQNSSDSVGRPLVQEPHEGVIARDFSNSATAPAITPGAVYIESGQRWMEKQEARSLREALEDMDIKEEERLHAAAQDEASELVRRHRNPEMPHKSPYAPYDYKQHLRKGSHIRSQSSGLYPSLEAVKEPQALPSRSISNSTTSMKNDSHDSRSTKVLNGLSEISEVYPNNGNGDQGTGHKEWDSPEKKAYMNLGFPKPSSSLFKNRRSSSGSRFRNTVGETGKSPFRNPNDQIYEEPKEIREPELVDVATPAPLKIKNRNASLKTQDTKDLAAQPLTGPANAMKKLSQSEIHRNMPSQSRNPLYVKNALPPTPPDSASASETETQKDKSLTKNGVDIRSDEIRAATSMRLKDRSPKLPTPTVVSDRPGRPIVSFDRAWKARETEHKKEESSAFRLSGRDGTSGLLPRKPQLPSSIASAPAVPTISVLEAPTIVLEETPTVSITPSINVSDVPTISVSTPDVPTIHTPEPRASARSLPNTVNRARPIPNHRPAPHHSSTAPLSLSKSHWSPASHRATAQCAACALHISGRIVSAASQRFHPTCFTCYHCSELLECVAFYPEPDDFRSSRLARIEARINGQEILTQDGRVYTELDDGDDSLRFYCHLDFHENFSPRCRSCKTPIEGEVVVACGGEWHVGHFFCAECGDPFDSSTPFVEKNGYAWCVDCHCKKFSGKCAGCKRPVTDMVVKALGKEWHEGCFCCKVCYSRCRHSWNLRMKS